ncbi:MAG: low temperature requirement protein A [Hyphomonas sp.]|uniref:low temperature requirement protein A n=1 Tax=Hyphomonas sp. TaxID=87 RepID=UPI00352755BD
MIGRLEERDPDEHHRVATPLELFVDLASVIAIAAAAAGLHHALAEAHYLEGLLVFLITFFAIWIAWLNYTWFASAFDDDSVSFKLATFVFLSGSLVMAAGVTEFTHSRLIRVMVIGYVIMRLAMAYLWFSAAKGSARYRATCLRYGWSILAVQVYWVVLGLFLWEWAPPMLVLFAVGAVLELIIPFWSERAGMTPWHRHHIIERYGLLTIIVLGETLLSTSFALRETFDAGEVDVALIRLAASAAIITFAMWWVYFTREDSVQGREPWRIFTWGYGHIPIFAGAAAVGAGVAAAIDMQTHHAHAPLAAGHWAIAIAVAVYLVGLTIAREAFNLTGANRFILLAGALLSLATPLLPWPMESLATLMVATAAIRTILAKNDPKVVASFA